MRGLRDEKLRAKSAAEALRRQAADAAEGEEEEEERAARQRVGVSTTTLRLFYT